MKQYLDLLRHILDKGENKGDRTGNAARNIFESGHRLAEEAASDWSKTSSRR